MNDSKMINPTLSKFYKFFLKNITNKGKLAAFQLKRLHNLRNAFISVYKDPGVLIPINGLEMAMPLSHNMPIYKVSHPYYDTTISRLTVYIRTQKGYLKMIDVGANIGDTILLSKVKNDAADYYVAVEPSDKFYPYLQYNCQSFQNIHFVKAICVAQLKDRQLTLIEHDGTAKLMENNADKSSGITEGGQMVMTTVDKIVSEDADKRPYNFLKVDTDGFDLEVLEGAKEMIELQKPIILFECDDFGIENFNQKCMDFIQFLNQVGYTHILFYDNYGLLLTSLKCDDVVNIKSLLVYRTRAAFRYYDLVCLQDADYQRFMKEETTFFENH